jgi:hypothetical protein
LVANGTTTVIYNKTLFVDHAQAFAISPVWIEIARPVVPVKQDRVSQAKGFTRPNHDCTLFCASKGIASEGIHCHKAGVARVTPGFAKIPWVGN